MPRGRGASFSARTKEELARLGPTSPALQWSELGGLVRAAGHLHLTAGGPYLELVHEQGVVARRSYRLLRELAGVEANLWARRLRRLNRGTRYLVRVPPGPGLDALCRRLGLLVLRVPAVLLAGPGRRTAWLRGLFLGGGSLADPEREHHLELVCGSAEVAAAAERCLTACGIAPRRAERRGVTLLYWKDGEQISEFLRLVGARRALFAYEEARIWAQVRNDVNRLVNAETANVGKSVAAAMRQLDDIRLLLDSDRRLPPPLEQIALARMSHPELSLAELGRLLSPPLGKSGTSHRLRQLNRLANEVRAFIREDKRN